MVVERIRLDWAGLSWAIRIRVSVCIPIVDGCSLELKIGDLVSSAFLRALYPIVP